MLGFYAAEIVIWLYIATVFVGGKKYFIIFVDIYCLGGQLCFVINACLVNQKIYVVENFL